VYSPIGRVPPSLLFNPDPSYFAVVLDSFANMKSFSKPVKLATNSLLVKSPSTPLFSRLVSPLHSLRESPFLRRDFLLDSLR